ncbi:MAG: hypothetical protein GY811_06935 [Myxococcales bacterium]|nr:hypothetical protein [Myxococcales bacterium]
MTTKPLSQSDLHPIVFMMVPPALAFGIAYFLSGEDTRVYYGIAGAIGGWVVGANIYDSKRKKSLKAKQAD